MIKNEIIAELEQNIDDYILSDVTSHDCAFNDKEVNEIYSTFASESGEKVLENAIKKLDDDEYKTLVHKIAVTIYNNRMLEKTM